MLDSVDKAGNLLAELAELKLHRRVERFLYLEAELMDSHQFEAWFALWAEDCHYWVPSSVSEADPVPNVSIINDRHKDLQNRVGRLRGRFAFAQQPRSRLSRVVSNIVVGEERDGKVTVTSRFVLGELRHQRANVIFGETEHKLLISGQQMLIAQKKVTILNNDSVMPNMVFLL